MDTNRDILIGVLALRSGLIGAAQFSAAYNECAGRPDGSLADVLVERGWINPLDRELLFRRLDEQLSDHHGDARAVLDTELDDDVRALTNGLAETDIQTQTAPDDQPRSGATPTPEKTQAATGAPQSGTTGAELPETVVGAGIPKIFSATMTAPPDSDDGGGHVLLSELSYGSATTEERYTITRLHAKGGIGQVWLARDAALGREVALKELRPERAESRDLTNRFLVEARVTGQLEHPGIVPIYELARRGDDQHPFYTMRFVRGGTFEEAIHAYHKKRKEGGAGPLELLSLLNAFVAVCNAVAYAHSRGIVHRDIKGQNVVLGDFGEVIVLDWGLAKQVDSPPGADPDAHVAPPVLLGESAHPSATIAGQAVGTAAYMPPEQAEGRLDKIGPWSDVYSLGAMLYEVFAGCPPFSGSNTTEVLRKVVNELPVSPRRFNHSAPRSLEAVCLKAMAKAPGDRYGSASALAKEVQRFLADEPVTAYREPLTKRAARWARRHRTAVAAMLVLVATTLAAVSIGAVLVSRERDEARRQRAQARRAVDEMYTEVAEKWLEDRLDPLQEQFLERVLAYYEGFTQQDTDEPIVRQERGRAYLRVGDVLRKLGRLEEAESAYRRALEVLGKLANDYQASADFRHHLAHARHQLAALLATRGEASDEAESLYRQALNVQEALVNNPNAPLAYQLDLAKTCKSLADLYRIKGKRTDAEASYRRAVELGEALLTASPKEPVVLNDLSGAYDKLGLLDRELGKYADADKAYRRALALQDSLAADYPTLPRHREALVAALNGLGLFLQDTGKVDEGEKAIRRAVEVAEGLVRDFPLRPEARRDAAKSHLNLGSVLVERKNRLEEAEQNQRRAIALYEALLTEVADVAQYRFDLARTYNDLGGVLDQVNAKEEAEESYNKAIAHYETLFAANPDTPRYRQGLAVTLSNLGILLKDTGRPEDAERCYHRSVELGEALAKEFPEASDHRKKLARTLLNLGNLLRQRERPREAEAAYRRAWEITETLVTEFPEVPDHRMNLAKVLNSLAGLKPPDAETIYRRVIALAEKLVTDFPKAPGYRLVLAIGRQNLGERLAKEYPEEAETDFRQAEAILEQLIKEFPKFVVYQSYLGEVTKNLGILRLDHRAAAEARPLLERAARLARTAHESSPGSAEFRGNLRAIDALYAAALLLAGDHAEAARTAEELAKVAPEGGRAWACLDAARIVVRCVPLVEKDVQIPEAERKARAQAYGAQAVALLRQAFAAGYRDFNAPRRAVAKMIP